VNEFEGAPNGFAELAQRLDRIEVRLNGLEEDPLRRGYAFLVSESEELRKDGIRSLRRVGRFDPEARAAIRQLLGDPSVGVRLEALDALADLKDKESVPGMLALLSDEDAGVRRRVLEALAECEAREAVPSIARQLALDGDDKVREEAADILGRMRDPSASESLVAALKDPNERVRGEAIASLGEIGDRTAQPFLREIYEANPGEHRRRLVFALKSLGDGEPLRREVAGITQTLLQSEKEDSRREALWLLAKFAGESSRSAIQQAAEADPSPGIRRDAGRILKEWKR
jgi:HEAT repeat protein